VVRQVLMMRDEGAFEPGLDWIHVLGVSQTKWAVILTAIQKALRATVNTNIRISYDSASPNIIAGKFEEVAIFPKFSNREDSWAIGTAPSPNARVYVKDNNIAFPFLSPLGDKMKLHHLNVVDEEFNPRFYDEISNHLLTHHNIWVYVRSMLQANELAFLDRAEAEQFVPKNLLALLYLIYELFTVKDWEAKLKKNLDLFTAVDKMSKDEVIIV